MLIRLLKTSFLTFFVSSQLIGLVNLEDGAQNFVLKTKQITIMGYPHAFNPSIIKWDDKLLMSFRIVVDGSVNLSACHSSSESQIGLQWLDKDFNPIGEPQIMDFEGESYNVLRSEDARLIKILGKCYLVYSDNRNAQVADGGFRMHVTELKKKGTHFFTGHTDCILHFERERKQRREKNWVPFDYQGNLMLAYSLIPHRILYKIPFTNYADTVCKSRSQITWDYGELRGGTPALLDDGEYLAFFHSSKEMKTVHSKGKKISHYFIGAYTFNQDPPFEITKISPEPIVAEGFYDGKQYKPYWKPVRVVFPCGLIIDEHYIYISYGRQDHEIWIVQMDKKKLKHSLVPVH
jgi:predicted GH43/DUF377 family glycosyl hydrolase